jgi:hypothetical protein
MSALLRSHICRHNYEYCSGATRGRLIPLLMTHPFFKGLHSSTPASHPLYGCFFYARSLDTTIPTADTALLQQEHHVQTRTHGFFSQHHRRRDHFGVHHNHALSTNRPRRNLINELDTSNSTPKTCRQDRHLGIGNRRPQRTQDKRSVALKIKTRSTFDSRTPYLSLHIWPTKAQSHTLYATPRSNTSITLTSITGRIQ